MLKRTARTIAAIGLSGCLIAGVSALPGCQKSIIGNSDTDKYTVFQDEDAERFIPSPLDVVSTKTGREVVVVASGWWAKDSYIHYGVKVENPNPDLIARDVILQITSYDKHGTELSRDTAAISFVGPSTVIGFAGECGSGQKPETVEIAILGTTVWQDADGYTEPLFVASVTEQDKGYYRYEFTGGITNCTGAYVSSVPITILLEDEDGNILAGYAGSTKRIKSDRTKDYQITINTAPDHAQVEVFAHWSTLNDTVNEALEE